MLLNPNCSCLVGILIKFLYILRLCSVSCFARFHLFNFFLKCKPFAFLRKFKSTWYSYKKKLKIFYIITFWGQIFTFLQRENPSHLSPCFTVLLLYILCTTVHTEAHNFSLAWVICIEREQLKNTTLFCYWHNWLQPQPHSRQLPHPFSLSPSSLCAEGRGYAYVSQQEVRRWG